MAKKNATKKTAAEVVETVVQAVEASKPEGKVVTVDNCVIKSVSSPSTIARVAQERGINPQEVFVRVVFQHGNSEYKVSNKLRFLTKEGYTKLIEAQKNGSPMKLAVDVIKEFFYIENDVSVDDLFKDALPKEEKKNTLTSLTGLLA